MIIIAKNTLNGLTAGKVYETLAETRLNYLLTNDLYELYELHIKNIINAFCKII